MGEPRFRRTVVAVALLHLIAVVALVWWSTREVQMRQPKAEVSWFNPAQFAPPDFDEEEETPTPEPTPLPPVESEPEPTPELTASTSAESDLVLPTPTPTPTPTPEPTPTPKQTPTPTPTPKPSPTPSPKPSPKPTPKASPSPSPKASPKKSPAETPKPPAKEAPASSPAQAPKAQAAVPKPGEGRPGSSDAAGSASGGGGTSDFGWYHEMIHDRFFGLWDQPTSIVGSANFIATLRITIGADGRISDFRIIKSSGNVVMDESVLAAARRVLKVDAPPKSLAPGGAYSVNINFELE
jgi:TonB family protein